VIAFGRGATRDPFTRAAVARIAHAVRPYVDSERGPTRGALELSRNVVAVLRNEPSIEPGAVLDEMLRHRVMHGWLACGDVRSAVRAGSLAWLRLQLGGLAS
jgi:hypothetical protein